MDNDRTDLVVVAGGTAAAAADGVERVSCTVREDVLPLLRELGRRPDVARIVLHLDPEQVCWAVLHVWVTVPRCSTRWTCAA